MTISIWHLGRDAGESLGRDAGESLESQSLHCIYPHEDRVIHAILMERLSLIRDILHNFDERKANNPIDILDRVTITPLTKSLFIYEAQHDVPQRNVVAFYREIGNRLRETSVNTLALTDQLNANTEGLLEVIYNLRASNLDLISSLNDLIEFTDVLDTSKTKIQLATIGLEELLEYALTIARSKPYDGPEISFSIRFDTAIPLVIRTQVDRLQRVLIILLAEAAQRISKNIVDPTVHLIMWATTGASTGHVNLTFIVTNTPLVKSKKVPVFSHYTHCDGPYDSAQVILCKRLLDLLKGSLAITHRCSTDITFVCEVPVSIQSLDNETSTSEPPDGCRDYTHTALVVEDNSADRIRLAEILYSIGVKPVTCASKEEARVHIQRGCFDLIFARRGPLTTAGPDNAIDHVVEILGVGEDTDPGSKPCIFKPFVRERVESILKRVQNAIPESQGPDTLRKTNTSEDSVKEVIIGIDLTTEQKELTQRMLLRQGYTENNLVECSYDDTKKEKRTVLYVLFGTSGKSPYKRLESRALKIAAARQCRTYVFAAGKQDDVLKSLEKVFSNKQ